MFCLHPILRFADDLEFAVQPFFVFTEDLDIVVQKAYHKRTPLFTEAWVRIQEACHYLDFTELKISQISPLVGYEDSLYFSRQFTKYMGMSPSEYKSKKKG